MLTIFMRSLQSQDILIVSLYMPIVYYKETNIFLPNISPLMSLRYSITHLQYYRQ